MKRTSWRGILKNTSFLIILVNKLRKHSDKPIKGNRIVILNIMEEPQPESISLSKCVMNFNYRLQLQINWLFLFLKQNKYFFKNHITLIEICFVYLLKECWSISFKWYRLQFQLFFTSSLVYRGSITFELQVLSQNKN